MSKLKMKLAKHEKLFMEIQFSPRQRINFIDQNFISISSKEHPLTNRLSDLQIQSHLRLKHFHIVKTLTAFIIGDWDGGLGLKLQVELCKSGEYYYHLKSILKKLRNSSFLKFFNFLELWLLKSIVRTSELTYLSEPMLLIALYLPSSS